MFCCSSICEAKDLYNYQVKCHVSHIEKLSQIQNDNRRWSSLCNKNIHRYWPQDFGNGISNIGCLLVVSFHRISNITYHYSYIGSCQQYQYYWSPGQNIDIGRYLKPWCHERCNLISLFYKQQDLSVFTTKMKRKKAGMKKKLRIFFIVITYKL